MSRPTPALPSVERIKRDEAPVAPSNVDRGRDQQTTPTTDNDVSVADGEADGINSTAEKPAKNSKEKHCSFEDKEEDTKEGQGIDGDAASKNIRFERKASQKERHCSFSDRDRQRAEEREKENREEDPMRPRCASHGADPRRKRPYPRRHSFHGTRDALKSQRGSIFTMGASMDAAIRRPSLASLASRGNWGSKWEFLLSCVGLSVGIGNVWRFPYLAYQNGGGAFLIPYLIMLTLVGKPMYFMELAFGQFAGVGPIAIWNCVPIGKGIGWAMITVSLIVCIYYNVIMAYTVFYSVASLNSVVPWSWCDPEWADLTTCYVRSGQNADAPANFSYSGNDTMLSLNATDNTTSVFDFSRRQTATQQYWERYVLKLSPGIEDVGPVKWDLALCLLFSWIIVVLCLIKGIKTSGKVVYFAATFPYVILLTLLVTGLVQEGAMQGVLYFITPSWDRLLDIQVWRAAAGQMFFSLSVSMGGLIMYSSYNDFRNNVYRDALVVSVLDTVTSIIAGSVTFSILGAMAHDLEMDIADVVKEGPGLAFVAYPEALLRLPVPQLWAILFFLMLFVLGLDSEFALLENVLTSLSDEYPILRTNKLVFCVFTALFCYLIGLSCVTYGGNYVLTLMDVYGGGTAILLIAVAEAVGIIWLYGPFRICDDIQFMLGIRPGLYWRIAWGYFTPIILVVIFVYAMCVHEPLKYEDYDFPDWADAIGWGLALISLVQIPLWAAITVYQQPGPTFKEKFRQSLRPSEDWGPSDPMCRDEWLAMVEAKETNKLGLSPLRVVSSRSSITCGSADNPVFNKENCL